MTQLVALVAATIAIDGLVWGAAGYLLFRLLGGRRRWWVGIVATVAARLAEQALVFLPLLRLLDLRVGDEHMAWLLSTDRLVDLLTFDPLSDVPLTALATVLGFLLAGLLDERRERRAVARGEGSR
ncbi:MAG: hypothetical protein AB1689_23390 [Thermodesulfobacteriota bacterium]